MYNSQLQLIIPNIQFTYIHRVQKNCFLKNVCNDISLFLTTPLYSSSLLFEIFPFIVIFGESMEIQTIGKSLMQTLPKETHHTEICISKKCGYVSMLSFFPD